MKKIKLVNSLFVLFVLVNFTGVTYTQEANRLNYWLKIKPFENTKSDVEKFFLKGTTGINDKYSFFYRSYYGGANVRYSKGACNDEDLNLWNIPEWTVTEVFYTTDDAPPQLESLLKDLEKYNSRPAGDRIDKTQYYNEEKGISITYDTDDKKVIEIKIKPTSKQRKKYDCNLTKN